MIRLLVKRSLVTCAKKNAENIKTAIIDSSKQVEKISSKIIFDKEDEEDEYEDMFMKTVFKDIEWGGPLRGGRMLEPTRFGDWERKGRCSDY